MKIRARSVADKAQARGRFRRRLQATSDFAVCGEQANGPESVPAVHREQPPSLGFALPEPDGFAVLGAVAVQPPSAVVMVTALPPDRFLRVGRSATVSQTCITRILTGRHGGQTVTRCGDVKVSVSRNFRKHLRTCSRKAWSRQQLAFRPRIWAVHHSGTCTMADSNGQ